MRQVADTRDRSICHSSSPSCMNDYQCSGRAKLLICLPFKLSRSFTATCGDPDRRCRRGDVVSSEPLLSHCSHQVPQRQEFMYPHASAYRRTETSGALFSKPRVAVTIFQSKEIRVSVAERHPFSSSSCPSMHNCNVIATVYTSEAWSRTRSNRIMTFFLVLFVLGLVFPHGTRSASLSNLISSC